MLLEGQRRRLLEPGQLCQHIIQCAHVIVAPAAAPATARRRAGTAVLLLLLVLLVRLPPATVLLRLLLRERLQRGVQAACAQLQGSHEKERGSRAGVGKRAGMPSLADRAPGRS